MITCDECCVRKGQALGLLCAECAEKLQAKVADLTNRLTASQQAIAVSLRAERTAREAMLERLDAIRDHRCTTDSTGAVWYRLDAINDAIEARGKAGA